MRIVEIFGLQQMLNIALGFEGDTYICLFEYFCDTSGFITKVRKGSQFLFWFGIIFCVLFSLSCGLYYLNQLKCEGIVM
jgi:hypothetical protein